MTLLRSKQGWNPPFLPAPLHYTAGLSEACAGVPLKGCAPSALSRSPAPEGAAAGGWHGTQLCSAVPKGRTRAGDCSLQPTRRGLQLWQRWHSPARPSGCCQDSRLPAASAPSPQSCTARVWLILLHPLACSGLDSKFPPLFHRRHSPCQLLTSGPAPRLSAPD